MIFLNKTGRRIAILPISLLFSFLMPLVLSCNLGTEEGRTYINVRKDSAWAAFDSLEITWKDSISGSGGTLFDGDPADMAAANKLLADGYQGGKIVVTFKGYKDTALIYEERRGFDGADPGKVTKEIIPIVVIVPIDSPSVTGPRPKAPKLSDFSASPDSIVSINDFVSFSAKATLDSGSLKNYAWSYEGKEGMGFFGTASAINGKSAEISGGHRYAKAGTYQVALRVASDSDSISTSRIDVQVLQDPPTADAGRDITVYPLATVKLQGAGEDDLGRIVRTEWKIGAADFAISGSDTAFNAPPAPGDLPVLFRVTDDDGQTAVDTLIVHVIPENESNLSGLSLSAGPILSDFSPETVFYTISLANPVDSTLVTATAGTAASTLAINKQTAQSGVGFPVKIPTGVSAITVAVTAPGGEVKTYTIIVTREKNGNADLSNLIPSADSLSPAFDRNRTVYALAVNNDVGGPTPFTIKPEMAAATSTYSINANGAVVEPADLAAPIPLRVGANALEIKVRAENGDAKTYTLTVTRAPNGDAALSALTVAPGALDSAFTPGDTSYVVAVGNATTAITVTPAKAASTSKITVNGKPVSSGAASEAIALDVGPNGIAVVVTAENSATRTYLLSVIRAKNGNTELSGLVPSVGTLTPDFNPDRTDYGFQAGFSDSLVRITPTAADSHSTIQVNGKAVASGSASEFRKIQVGGNANVFIIVVTAENLAQKVYNVSAGRLPNSQSTLKSLVVSSGTLVQKSALEYADTVSHSTLNVTLTPVASDPNAVVTVASAAAASAVVAPGSASAAIPLAVGDNRIECLVTAQDGTTQTLYTVQVTRLALLTRNRMLGSAISVLDSVEIPLGRPYQQSAPAVTGFHFVKWSTVTGTVAFGDTNAAATSVTLSLGDARIQAAYDTNTYTLAVTATNGSVARNPDQAAYNHGKSVVLTVTPATGYQFSSWSDGNTANPRTVSMVSNTVLTATCTAIPVYTLTLGGSPSGSGSVTANPAGPSHYSGTGVSLTPTPAAGHHFVNWSGDLTGSAVPGSVSMTADKSITAHFAPDQYTLTVTVPADVPFGCATTPSGSLQVGNGAATSITATNCKRSVAACGSGTVYLYYDFSGWSAVSGSPVFASAGSASTKVTLSSGNATIRANYAPPRDVCE